jgi:hypothetical protein
MKDENAATSSRVRTPELVRGGYFQTRAAEIAEKYPLIMEKLLGSPQKRKRCVLGVSAVKLEPG